jgi:hypothetical protein
VALVETCEVGNPGTLGMTKGTAALTVAMGRVSMKFGDQQTCTSGGRDSAGDDRVSQAIS